MTAAAIAACLLLSAHGAASAQTAQTTSAGAPAASPAVISILLQQGRYWQDRQPGRAAEAWQKLLTADPGNAEALAGLGHLAIEADRSADARRYLEQLRRSHPESSAVKQLESDLDLSLPASKATLDQARVLVREKRFADAVAQYRQLFKGQEPRGPIGVEYYSVLGYVPAGREEAMAGLQRLQKTGADDPQIALTSASLRLQSENSRLDAMRSLAALSRRTDVGGQATEQWRGAMGWLGSPPPAAYQPLFRQYLAANPEDTEIREQLAGRGPRLPGQDGSARTAGNPGGGRQAAGRNGRAADAQRRLDPESLRMADGFAALQNNQLDEAEAGFSAARLLKPRSGGPLGGLGLVRLKQQRFGESRAFLQQAVAIDGPDQWKQALDSATYWDLVQQANAARSATRYDDAVSRLQQAAAMQPEGDDNTAEMLLGGVYNDMKRHADAERVFRNMLAREPDDMDALGGLLGTLSATGRQAEALAVLDDLSADQRKRLNVDKLRAELAFAEGVDLVQRGQDAPARAKLQQAVDLQPDNPWMCLELARLDLHDGARPAAAERMQALLARRPEDAETVYTNGLFLAETRDWPGTLEMMNRVPSARRTNAMARLQRSAAIHVQADQALALAHDGRRADANALLAQAGGRVGDDGELLGIVARGYVDLGEPARAGQLLRAAIDRSQRDPAASATTTDLQLSYGDVLLATEDDRNLADLLRQLQARSQAVRFDGGDQQHFETLRRAYVMRQAEALRTQKRRAEAYELIKPLLAETPQDPALLGLLARMYQDDGQADRARGIYRDLLARDDGNVNTLLAAAGLAGLQRDFGAADAYVTRAESLAPENPDVLAARGRLYRMEGRPGRAVDYLKRAADALQTRAAGTAAPSPPISTTPQEAPPRLASGSNPFTSFATPARAGG